ncbi:MAG: four helix bundle protein [Patescibacteria group bacterium]
MDSFTDLEAWKVGMELLQEIYALTKRLPKEEQYGMTSQLRRATTSILANLAEGFSRASPADKAHKYTISRGECSEVKAYLLICIELRYFQQQDGQRALELVEREGQLFSGLIRAFSPRSEP